MTRPDSIRSLGLERHLNTTKDLHNNRGYAELVKYINLGDELVEPLPVTRMARAFNVTPITMDKWLIIYHEEKRPKS